MKKKIIIGIICFTIGIVLLISGLLIKNNFQTKNKPSGKVENKIVEFLVFDPICETVDESTARLKFKIFNNGNKDAINEKINVNFYEGDKVIYTADLEFDEIGVEVERDTDGTHAFPQKQITKCEFLYNGKVLDVYDSKKWYQEHGFTPDDEEMSDE